MSKGKSSKPSASRREFVKKSVATGVLAALSVNGAKFAKAFAAVAGSEVRESQTEFDYIVVGSGPGGGPLAVNLAKAGYKVLVIEAGGSEKPLSTYVPAMQAHASEDASVTWKFYVKYYSDLAQQMRNTKYNADKGGVFYPRGSTLGGSSSVNALITMYPDNSDWENLVKLTGSQDFEPNEMRRQFQKLERNNYRLPGWDNQSMVSRNGYQGWLPTSMTPLKFLLRDSNFANLVTAAARAEGLWSELSDKVFNVLGMDLDPNSWSHVYDRAEGLFTPPKNTEKGIRWGLREHLEDTAKKLPNNLIIKTRTLATRVLFSPDDATRAIGVACVAGSNLYKADANASKTSSSPREIEYTARKEVILAGGAFNSPQLLMLSGIGDREHLSSMGIATRVNLPGVGLNLQDRYEVGVVSKLPGAFEALKNCKFNGQNDDPCLEEIKEWGSQSIYSSNGVIVGVKKRSVPTLHDPDLFMFALPGGFKGYYDGYAKDVVKPESYTWAILKGHTKNTAGSVRLRTSNPLEVPEINFRFFDDGKSINGEDMQSMLQAIKMVRRMNEKMPATSNVTEQLPGAGLQTDEQLKTFVRDEVWGHHASCSNKMGAAGVGNENSDRAVVDPQFRVYGTKNLRVVDASVFPKIPGLFIALPIYMMSEKASEIILRDSGRRS